MPAAPPSQPIIERPSEEDRQQFEVIQSQYDGSSDDEDEEVRSHYSSSDEEEEGEKVSMLLDLRRPGSTDESIIDKAEVRDLFNRGLPVEHHIRIEGRMVCRRWTTCPSPLYLPSDSDSDSSSRSYSRSPSPTNSRSPSPTNSRSPSPTTSRSPSPLFSRSPSPSTSRASQTPSPTYTPFPLWDNFYPSKIVDGRMYNRQSTASELNECLTKAENCKEWYDNLYSRMEEKLASLEDNEENENVRSYLRESMCGVDGVIMVQCQHIDKMKRLCERL